jgi:citrate lyase subunit gamma (acyl carrier protein)
MNKQGQAGTLESNDIHIIVSETMPGTGIKIELTSTVLLQYGTAIKQTIEQVCKILNVNDAAIKAADKGALDCTIQARVKTALQRAGMAKEA